MPFFRQTRPRVGLLSTLIVAGLVSLATNAYAGTPQGYLYVGDLNDRSLLRFDATYPSANYGAAAPGASKSGANYITSYGVTEGVHGTANTLITSAGSSKKISRFDLAGNYINDVATGFAGIGNIDITSNAQYVYVPDEAGNKLFRVRTLDGFETSVTFTGVHDVVVGPDGYIYAGAYTGSSGIVRYNADLTGKTTVIANGSNGLTRPSGMTFSKDGKTLFVVQNTNDNSDGSILSYAKDSSGNFTYKGKITSSLLKFGFGIDIGPDGNLYFASLGSYQTQSYTDCIAKVLLDSNTTSGFSSSANAVTGFIVTGQPAAGGLQTPKYLKFDTNFANALDPGASFTLPTRADYSPPTPEPGEFVFTGIFGLGLTGLILRARRRRIC